MDIKEFIGKYKYRTELHAHTKPVSGCAHILAEDAVRIYSDAGVDSIVITNHLTPEWNGSVDEYLDDYYRAKLAGEEYNINVILGCEIRFAENSNDYLVYGITPEDIPEMLRYTPTNIHEFYCGFKNEKNLILQAHPFRRGMVLANPGDIDGIESFNLHPGHNSAVGCATKYARENKMLVSVGSDYHHLEQHALGLLRSKQKPSDSYDIAALLKSRDYLFDLSGHIVFPYC